MSKDIYTAVRNLPADLITKEIANAAIAEGNLGVINHLPHKYLSGEIIEDLIDRGGAKYSSNNFSLAKVPQQFRTQKVCLCSVKKERENFIHVPEQEKSIQITDEIIAEAEYAIDLLSGIPEANWHHDVIYKAIRSIYHHLQNDSYQPKGRGYYYNSSAQKNYKDEYRCIQILLSFVPGKLKNRQFYYGLFANTKLAPELLQMMIPAKYQQKSYYHLLAMYSFDFVPEKEYNYKTLMILLHPDNKAYISSLKNKEKVLEKIYELMDDKMADALVLKEDSYFKELPDQFRTEQRLLFLINSMNKEKEPKLEKIVDIKVDSKLLTPTVCKAIIDKGSTYPVFPASVWNEEFRDFCFKNDKSFQWFSQMPKELQTTEIIEAAVEKATYNIEYCRKDLISYDLAADVYRFATRGSSPTEYLIKPLPSQWFNDFMEETGLPKEFFGGELSFYNFREKKEKNTYCRLGNIYLGYYQHGNHRNSPFKIIMTRRTARSPYPEMVFSKPVGTFHKTWLEKIIADNDPAFQKPTVSKSHKLLQENAYYEVKLDQEYNGVKIYRNLFMGETIQYVVDNGYPVIKIDLDHMKQWIDDNQKKEEEIKTAV